MTFDFEFLFLCDLLSSLLPPKIVLSSLFILPLKISHNVPPGTVATFWGWWDKLSDNKGTVNNVTSTKLTDLGGGGTFYDCRVEVERWGGTL